MKKYYQYYKYIPILPIFKPRKSGQLSAKRGFTFVEIIVVIAIFLTLIGLTLTNPLNLMESTSINTTVDTLITDIKNQQIKAMVGDTEGRGVPDTYSVYIEPTQYVLFHGQNYSPGDPSNFSVVIDSKYQLSTNFTDSKIIFTSGSGEIVGLATEPKLVTITETRTGQKKEIKINKYGVIIQVDSLP